MSMIKVLLVDDHDVVRHCIARMLRKKSDIQIVGECSLGEEVLASFKNLSPDVVVLDVELPDTSGIRVARRLFAKDADSKILMLSAHTDPSIIISAFNAGALGYVCKGSKLKELVEGIRTVSLGKQYCDQMVSGVLAHAAHAHSVAAPKCLGKDLSAQEVNVLQLICDGRNTKGIASELHISINTVATHRRRIMDKLQIKHVAGLVKYALQSGLTELSETNPPAAISN